MDGKGLLHLLLGNPKGGGKGRDGSNFVDEDNVGQDRSKFGSYRVLSCRVMNGVADFLLLKDGELHRYRIQLVPNKKHLLQPFEKIFAKFRKGSPFYNMSDTEQQEKLKLIAEFMDTIGLLDGGESIQLRGRRRRMRLSR